MFKKRSLFIILDTNEDECQVNRIEITKEAQVAVCALFSEATDELKNEKESICFNGSYKPEQNELFVIENFDIDQEIIDAIKNPIGVTAFVPQSDNPPKIKALFMGKHRVKAGKEEYIIAFQRFRKDQYIARKGINLFHDKDTFDQDKRYGICVTDTIDSVVVNNRLEFTSFYYARQIFDLAGYYREATDSDVEAFIKNDKINIEDISIFKANTDSWVRRKIALITDSGIFNKYSAKQIKDKGKAFGLSITTEKNKIEFPSEKKELKNLLKFLDDEIYKGVFSEEILQTNSKRKAEL